MNCIQDPSGPDDLLSIGSRDLCSDTCLCNSLVPATQVGKGNDHGLDPTSATLCDAQG